MGLISWGFTRYSYIVERCIILAPTSIFLASSVVYNSHRFLIMSSYFYCSNFRFYILYHCEHINFLVPPQPNSIAPSYLCPLGDKDGGTLKFPWFSDCKKIWGIVGISSANLFYNTYSWNFICISSSLRK